MPIAAVPKYIGQEFQDTSPGLRFGMYLKLWGVNRRTENLLWQTHDIGYEIRGKEKQEREVRYENKVSALKDSTKLTTNDKNIMQMLAARQVQYAQTVPAAQLLQLDSLTIAPFTTGLGNEHPLENGFAFLNPYGLPYLPGSGVKGVLRQAARELASGEWGETHGWSTARQYTIRVGKQDIQLSIIDVLFGLESKDGDSEHVRGALSFWDVIPQIKGDALSVEIMTPHQSHYYQGKKDRKSGDSISPHDSGQPNPIAFLTVPPGSQFTFYVVCDATRLARLAPDLLKNGPKSGQPRWQTLMTSAFEHAFQWLGFGAKTAVGYGAMQTKAMRSEKQVQQQREAAQQKHDRSQEQFLNNTERWEGARIKFNRHNKSLSVEKNGRNAIALAPKGEELLATLPPEVRKKVEANQFIKVTAHVAGNDLIGIEA